MRSDFSLNMAVLHRTTVLYTKVHCLKLLISRKLLEAGYFATAFMRAPTSSVLL